MNAMFDSSWIKAQHIASYTYTYIDSRTIYYTIIALIGIAYAYHVVLVKENPGAPPLVKSWIPFFGTAFSFTQNPEKFVLQCRQRYGDMYTIYMVGKRLHVVCDPFIGIPSIYKRDKTFCFSAVDRTFGLQYLGRSERILNHTEYEAANRALLVPLLLSQDQVNILITEFNRNLQPIILRAVNELHRQGKFGENSQSFSIDTWICRVMFECSGKTLFGETWPEDEKFFQDWKTWDDALYPMLKGYPSIFTRKARMARERYYERVLSMFKQPLVKPSKLIRERMEVDFFL
jgi:Cytochrome P450